MAWFFHLLQLANDVFSSIAKNTSVKAIPSIPSIVAHTVVCARALGEKQRRLVLGYKLSIPESVRCVQGDLQH